MLRPHLSALRDLFDFRQQPGLAFGIPRQKIEGPGETKSCRFMAGRDEGHEIIDDLDIGHHTPGFGIARGDQHGNEILTIRRVTPALFQNAHQARAQKFHRPHGPLSSRIGSPVRCADDAKCKGPAARAKIIGDAAFNPFNINAMTTGHHRFDNDIEGRLHHLVANIDRSTLVAQQAITGLSGSIKHGGLKCRQGRWSKRAGD